MGTEFVRYLAVVPHSLAILEGRSLLYTPVIIVLPLLAFLVISFVTQRWGKISAAVCTASLASSFLLSLFLALPLLDGGSVSFEWTWVWLGVGTPLIDSIDVGLLVDNLSLVTATMVTFIATLVSIYSYGYMTVEIGHFPTQGSASLSRFYGYLSLFVFSMLGLVFASHLLQIFIFWELVGLCSYFLIGFWYFKKSASDANKKSFIVTKFSDLFFLIGILAVGLGAGTFSVRELDLLTELPFSLFGSVALPLILIAVGPMGKSAQFPLHVWLPDAMEGPTPVSALIHAATMVAAGIYLVARLFGLYQLAPAAAYFVAFIGAFTALMAALIALVQNDIKKVLAYSTISQLGFMLCALGSGAYQAGLFHLFTHAFFKALLFLGSGAVIIACHQNDIWKMGGLKKHLPRTHLAFLIGCLALAGFPPFSGFWSKDEILVGVWHHPELFALLALSAFLTAFYVTRMYCIAFLGSYRGVNEAGPYAGVVPSPRLKPPLSPSRDTLGMEPEWNEEKADPKRDSVLCLGAKQEIVAPLEGLPKEVSPFMWGPLFALALFAALLGFVGMPGEYNMFGSLISHSSEGVHEFDLTLMLASIVIALAGIGLAGSLFAKDPVAGERRLRSLLGGFHTVLAQKLYLDHFWAWAVSKSVMVVAQASAWFDDQVIDGAVRIWGKATFSLGDRMRKEHTGQVFHHLLLLVVSLLLITFLMATIEPDFVLSPSRLFDFKGEIPQGGLFP